MYKNLRWKLLTIVAVTAISVWAFYPPSQKVRLGLDLRGGTHLVLLVKTDDAIKLETETTAEQLREALKQANVPYKDGASGISDFTIEGIPSANDAQFRKAADDTLSVSFDRESRPGGTYYFSMRPNIVARTREQAVAQAIQTIERRVNELGVSEPIVAPYGTAFDRIVVQLPGYNVQQAKAVISNTARLEMRLVEGGPAPRPGVAAAATRRAGAGGHGSHAGREQHDAGVLCSRRSRQSRATIFGAPARRSTKRISRPSRSRSSRAAPRSSAR